MSGSDDLRRDAAGRFLQAMRNKTFTLASQLFPPDVARELTDWADRDVEDQGLQREQVEVILNWFRSDEDAAWLDEFWQNPEGSRFLDLSVELMTRAILQRFAPHVPIPPPGKSY